MRRSIVSLLATIALSISRNHPLSAAGEVLILDYHTFLGNHSSSLDYDPSALADQLDEIRALGYRFVSLEDAISGKIEGRMNIVLTIDDGNRSSYEAYEDVLKPRSIRPELFVYPAPILKGNAHFLSASKLRLLAAEGCGIGAHGFYHEYMSEKAWRRGPNKVKTEATRPGIEIEKLTGKRPALFAYPFGVASTEAEKLLREQGYEWAFLAGDKMVWVDFTDPALDHLAVPRFIVYHWNLDQLMQALAKRLL